MRPLVVHVLARPRYGQRPDLGMGSVAAAGTGSQERTPRWPAWLWLQLMESKEGAALFPPDVIARAKHYISVIPGGALGCAALCALRCALCAMQIHVLHATPCPACCCPVEQLLQLSQRVQRRPGARQGLVARASPPAGTAQLGGRCTHASGRPASCCCHSSRPGVGAYSDSKGVLALRREVAAGIEARDGFPCDPQVGAGHTKKRGHISQQQALGG